MRLLCCYDAWVGCYVQGFGGLDFMHLGLWSGGGGGGGVARGFGLLFLGFRGLGFRGLGLGV